MYKKKVMIRKVVIFSFAFFAHFLILLLLPEYAQAAKEIKNFEIDWILPQEYYQGNDFVNGRAWVQKERQSPWTLFDKEGNIIKDGVEADSIGEYNSDGYCRFLVTNDLKLEGFFDIEGNIIFPPDDALSIYELTEGLIRKKGENGLLGYIDVDKKWVIPPKYDKAGFFIGGLTLVQKGEKLWYIDENDNAIVDFNDRRLEGGSIFLNEVAFIKIDSKLALINKKAEFLTALEFDSFFNRVFGVRRFKEWDEMIGVSKNGKAGFIDLKGNLVLDFNYEIPPEKQILLGLYSFSNDRAVIVISKEKFEFGVIDKTGKLLFTLPGDDRGRLFYPGKNVEKNTELYKQLRRESGINAYIPSYIGDYLVSMNTDGVVVYDKDGNSYQLSKYLPIDTIVYASEENIFRAERLYFGGNRYFKIKVKE